MSGLPESSSDSMQHLGEHFAEFNLPQGCMLCGGTVAIRSTPGGGTHCYCPHCHWLSRPRLRMRQDGLEIAYATQAFA